MSYFERVGSFFYLLNGLLHGSENSEKLVFLSEISENLKRETSSTPANTTVNGMKLKWLKMSRSAEAHCDQVDCVVTNNSKRYLDSEISLDLPQNAKAREWAATWHLRNRARGAHSPMAMGNLVGIENRLQVCS